MQSYQVIYESPRCQVGESPIWDEKTQKFYFVDIHGCCIYRMTYQTKKIDKIDVGQQIGCVALCENGDLLLAMEDGIYRMQMDGELSMAHKPVNIKGRRFNDGKVGPDGCFYVGTTDENGQGAFYRLQDGILTELFDGCGCSNGLDWSLDGKLMYYCDTPTQTIEIFDFIREQHTLSNRRPFFVIPDSWGKPDGFTVDDQEQIWLALWDGGCVVQLDTITKEVKSKIELPVRKASSCCFGGPELKDMFITTASMEDWEEYPLSGNLFCQEALHAGRVSNRYLY